MNHIVQAYYQAWEQKDIEALHALFETQPIIRTYLQELIFSTSELEEVLKEITGTYEVLEVTHSSDVYYATIQHNNQKLETKIVVVDGKIKKVFETTKQDTTRIKCIVSYDGSIYAGFQRQKDQRTVQGDIEKGLYYLTKEHITIHSSGRTDKDVHAVNQVFHFDTTSQIGPAKFAYVLKSYLPDAIYIKSSEKVPNTFHSRYDVKTKEYVYKINKGQYNPIMREYEWHVPNLNIDKLKAELQTMIGTHDFISFTKNKEEKETTRTIYDIWFEETDTHLFIHMKGNGFLRYMVRYLVGAAVEIAIGRITTTLWTLLQDKNPSNVRWIAPGTGLYLEEVTYYE